DSGHDNLIEVFLYSDIKHQLTCWKKLLQYFAFNAKIEISKDYLNHIYPEMSDNVIELFCTTIARDDDNFGTALESRIALPEISCLECDFSMTCLHCREGSLYVFHLLKDEKTNQLDQKEAGHGRQDVSKVSVCGLCAQLHNAEKIEAQMLPAEYYQLLKRVWDEALKILKKHNGTILSGNSNQMQCYFPETENETKHIQNAIKCALALAKNSRKISL
ncbi:MAG: hypothetical protein GY705_21915, partial [Bacteroidetes bacterium]|nr:hypothetical protein [Bacteroidota bacterium]